MIINVQNGKDLITVDLRVKQVRYVKGEDIQFFDLSNDDVAGYDYLFKNDKKLFLKALAEDVESFLGKKIVVKNLKVKS